MLPRSLLFLLCLVFGAAPALAQDGPKYLIPERIERATKADDKGLEQWEAWPETKCPSCNGSGRMKCVTCARFSDEAKICPDCKRTKEREVACWPCGGTGKIPDPLDKVTCPGCRGASFLVCMVCSGHGEQYVDKAKQATTCPGCRGEGAFKCTGCSGARIVETAAVKPTLRDAPAASLAKALAATEAALKELSAFTPGGGLKTRKEAKALAKTVETAGAYHPALKRLAKQVEDYSSRTEAGSNYQGHAERQAETLNHVKNNVEPYLKHQKRMLELAHKRAEANAKVEAAAKGK